MLTSVPASGAPGVPGAAMRSLHDGVRWGLDRMLSVAYGVVYDYIYAHFSPYGALQREVLAVVEAGLPEGADRREVRVLDVGCGPGALTCALAEAGFTVTGLDAYGALVEVAKEKRRTKRLANLAFRQADLAGGHTFRSDLFDRVVNVHSLYAHPTPDRLVSEAYRVLRPGGYAVFVNHTRRVGRWATLREIWQLSGFAAALRALLWVLPNAIFEAARRRTGPHYWDEATFAAHLRESGFTILELRRTFLQGSSLLVWARKGGAA